MEQISQGASECEAWAERFTASLHAHRHDALKFPAGQQERLDRAEAFVVQELRRLAEELAAQQEQADQFRAERDALATDLADVKAAAAGDREGVADERLREDYQQALRDLRHARSQIVELQEQAARARATTSKVAQQSQPAGRLDWEAEKQRILLALENDFDESDEVQQGQRLKIAEVLQTTEATVASKDREIQDLKERLQQSQENAVALGAASVSTEAAVDNDLQVREERERLKQLQEQWVEKLREAEVELALERAKLARQRVELEAQSRGGAETEQTAADAASSQRAAPSYRGRWLARLGLTDADREPRRVVGP